MQRLFEWMRDRVLRVLRVPHEPEPPAGAPGSIRAFRAGRNFYKLRLLRWGAGQVGALFGIIFSLSVLESLERGAIAFREEARLAAEAAKSAPRATAPAEGAPQAEPDDAASAPKPAKRKRARGDWKQQFGRTSERWPMWVFPLLRFLEWGGVLLYLVQIPVTYAMARLDFELRWYIVTDRSLRIRSGLATVQEMTMSFANVQQVVVAQGPLQRLLGIADVRVQSAGGGGGGEHQGGAHDSTHTGVFHGVENATEIRDLILARLRQFREAGLGDPDDQNAPVISDAPAGHPMAITADTLVAAREILEEARALRRSVT